jgi:hypothetical protein
MAPPARFELALPPPEGGALSPELRGLGTSVCRSLVKGRKAMYQRARGRRLVSYLWDMKALSTS